MQIARFDRRLFRSEQSLTRIGDGQYGGKARGLLHASERLRASLDLSRFPQFSVSIPRMTVLTTDIFDSLIRNNGLDPRAFASESDERIAHAFQRADLPVEIVGDLRALIEETRLPLAIRSSSLLEDAEAHPFAGVYGTKMIPNNQPEADVRFRRLIEAIKLVYASTWFASARDYAQSIRTEHSDEKMAVIVQEVVGERRNSRFYPDVSGVAKSYNFYPGAGVRPDDGVVSLALGLGKTIVDGDVSWTYAPTLPHAPPPYGSIGELLRNSQVRFWAVNMGPPPAYDPIAETEYLIQLDLSAADYDGTLRYVASTYDARSDRLSPGVGASGSRVVNFAPLLQLEQLPLNDLVAELLATFERELGSAVEIEFALTILPGSRPTARFGFLQVRPMGVVDEAIEVTEEELTSSLIVVGSKRVMGNGIVDSISDVIYVKPGQFEPAATRRIAEELAQLNRTVVTEQRRYLLIGFGRWGSRDPWLGIPVEWGQIGGAGAIVEATLPKMNVELSQGSHFFHNLSSFRVSYFMVHHTAQPPIDWGWLDAQSALHETEHVRHVRLSAPLRIKVDGRSGRGVIQRPA